MIYATGDREPLPGVDVLTLQHGDGVRLFLARYQTGWRWVLSKSSLNRHTTPLTWKFATSADMGVPTRLRTLTAEELSDWNES